MRMWMVNPRIMCRRHLLGEHVENHMFVTTLMQNKSVQGYIANNLLEPSRLEIRHGELVAEMFRRGYGHKSQWKGDWEKIAKHFQWGRIKETKVDTIGSLNDLLSRCPECRQNALMAKAVYMDTDSILIKMEGDVCQTISQI